MKDLTQKILFSPQMANNVEQGRYAYLLGKNKREFVINAGKNWKCSN